MKFVFHRDRTVSSTSGHSIAFKKGEPTHVPPEMVRDVIAVGGVPEDETFDPDAEDKSKSTEPTDPEVRRSEAYAAFKVIVEGGKREDFTAGGQPHPKALKALLGWPLNGKERDALWVDFNKAEKS